MKLKLKILFLIYLFSFSKSGYSQQMIWQEEREAIVNGNLMPEAYSGISVSDHCTFVDIDNDNDYDLFIGYDTLIAFIENIGNSTSPSMKLNTDFYFSIIINESSATPSFVDIDNDGDKDLFVGNGKTGCFGGHVLFFENTGNEFEASFGIIPDTLTYESYLGNQQKIDVCDRSVPVFEDIDNDGDKDLFIGGGYGKIAYYENIGDSNVPIWDSISHEYHGIDLGWKSAPTFADMDADGDKDLFIGSELTRVFFYENLSNNTGTVTWSSDPITENYGSLDMEGSFFHPTFVDIDGDGDLDYFVGNEDASLHFYENIGTPISPDWKLTLPNFISLSHRGGYDAPHFSDIDSDGDYDLLLAESDWLTSNPSFWIYINQGDESEPDWYFVSDSTNEYNIFSGGIPSLCDIDNDGDKDLFIGRTSLIDTIGGTIELYRNIGDSINPVWDEGVRLKDNNNSLIDLTFGAIPFFIDVDNDSKCDMVSGNRGSTINDNFGRLYYYRNVGSLNNPSFQFITDEFVLLDSINNPNGIPLHPNFTDIDYDGDKDLFLGLSNFFHFKNENGSYLFEEEKNSSPYIPCFQSRFVDIDDSCGHDFFKSFWSDAFGGGSRLHYYRNIGMIPEINQLIDTTFCTTNNEVSLVASPQGGIWEGVVSSDGIFDPSITGIGTHTLTYTFSVNGGCPKTDTITLVVENCTSINELKKSSTLLDIFPNPIDNATTISFELSERTEMEITISNLNGKFFTIIKKGIFNKGKHKFDWRKPISFPSGVYTLNLSTPKSLNYKKVVMID